MTTVWTLAALWFALALYALGPGEGGSLLQIGLTTDRGDLAIRGLRSGRTYELHSLAGRSDQPVILPSVQGEVELVLAQALRLAAELIALQLAQCVQQTVILLHET